jgi:hypothetical protein
LKNIDTFEGHLDFFLRHLGFKWVRSLFLVKG